VAELIQLKDAINEKRSFTVRTVVVFLVALALILLLLARLVQLQVIEYDSFVTRSDENRILVRPMPPERGLIFDRNGILLADNLPVFSLSIVSERVVNLQSLLKQLGEYVEISRAQIREFHQHLSARRRPFEPVALKLNLSEEEVAKVRVNGFRWPGVEITEETLRFYPLAGLTAHALGSVRRITQEDLKRLDPVRYSGTKYVGRLGVERFYEDSLHGEVGHELVEIDVRGRILKSLDATPPVGGQNLTLHLDSRLQIAARAALGERRGAIVALDTRSGGILAMVSNPAYDPNVFVTGIRPARYRELVESRDAPLFNRATKGQYAPGSTFKPIIGLAGLSVGVTDWERTIDDQGWFKLPNRDHVYRDWSWTRDDTGGQGVVDLRKAIYRSSNVYFYDLATKIDIDELAEFAARFGYGQVTTLDVADASSGVLPTRLWKQGAKGERWFTGDTVNLSIGQGYLLVTPLQMATVAMVIANRGRWIRPRMLLSSDTPLVDFNPPPPIPRVQGPEEKDWERMIDAMEDVVHRGNRGLGENGTAWAHVGRNVGYRMAGKSGTTQVVEILQGQEYNEEELDEYQRKHACFVAFAPADDPVIAVSVLVENGGSGSSVAGPMAKKVLDAYLLPQLSRR
jgi:penicillin-binding protein 2